MKNRLLAVVATFRIGTLPTVNQMQRGETCARLYNCSDLFREALEAAAAPKAVGRPFVICCQRNVLQLAKMRKYAPPTDEMRIINAKVSVDTRNARALRRGGRPGCDVVFVVSVSCRSLPRPDRNAGQCSRVAAAARTPGRRR